jgi:sec-independent protein translocase protein TatB
MPSLGMAEIIVIVIVALVLLGPDRLPKAARSVGKALNELRRHSDRVKDEFRDVVDFDEITTVHRDLTSIRDDFRTTLTSAGSSLVAADTSSDTSAPTSGPDVPAELSGGGVADETDATADDVVPMVVDAQDVTGTAAAAPASRRLPGTPLARADASAGDGRADGPDEPTPASILDAAVLLDDQPARRIPGSAGGGGA